MNSTFNEIKNLITAAVIFYRDRLDTYLPLGIIAGLWNFLPIYGWAKYGEQTGLVSRLAFGEMSGKPENISEAKNKVERRLWTFFQAGLFTGLVFFSAWILSLVVIDLLNDLAKMTGISFFWLLQGPLFIGIVIVYTWLFTRLSLVELIIAIEQTKDSTVAMGRSWELTKKYGNKLQLIFFVTWVISLLVCWAIAFSLLTILKYSIIFIPFSFYRHYISIVISYARNITSPSYLFIYLFCLGLIMPFWQSLKAAIYYQLKAPSN